MLSQFLFLFCRERTGSSGSSNGSSSKNKHAIKQSSPSSSAAILQLFFLKKNKTNRQGCQHKGEVATVVLDQHDFLCWQTVFASSKQQVSCSGKVGVGNGGSWLCPV
jgi:hypothetical protein